mmetsp:Transcript_34923/g.96461  ORF Transcript_34923/g.96461 Transcript_34923/m.96461 type:complete len:276 (-) Transcript_34923:59-886(-)
MESTTRAPAEGTDGFFSAQEENDEDLQGGLRRDAGEPPEGGVGKDVDAGTALAGKEHDPPKRVFGFLRRSSGRGAAGTQRRSENQHCGEELGLLAFLRGTGTDCQGRWLDEILTWDFNRMERCHDYVQWIFPTDEASRFNLRAPLLTAELASVVRGDAQALAAIRKALHKFCAFLGLEVTYEPLVVSKASHFEERVPVCWRGGGLMGTGGNHNWLRISRVLHCLRLVGLDAEAAALFAFLETLPQQGVKCDAAIVHWRKRNATVVEEAADDLNGH